jgi:uncharacterized repeat protein (TIGR01451 family)
MRLRRTRATLRPILAAFLAAILLAGGALPFAAAQNPPTVVSQPTAPVAAYLLYHPVFLHNHYNYQSALYVQNAGAVPATVQLTFYSTTASPIDLSATVQPGATLSYAPGQVAGLPHGLYWLLIASDQPLASVVEVYRATGDRLAAYRGITDPTGASAAGLSVPVYRSVFTPFFDTGGLTLWNIAAQDAPVTIDFYRADGSLAKSLPVVIPANRTYAASNPGIQIPPGSYTAVVSAAVPVVGLLSIATAGQPPALFELQPPVTAPGVTASLPRALKQVDEGGGSRTTQLFLTNAGSAGGPFDVTFLHANGSPVYVRALAGLPPFGTAVLDLATFDGLPNGIYGVRATGVQPLALSELTTYTTPPADHFVATYGERLTLAGQSLARRATTSEAIPYSQSLPRLARTAEAYTVFSVQNPSAQTAAVVIEYHDLAGVLVAYQDLMLAAGGGQRYDLRQVAALPAGFVGSAAIFSDQPVDVLADEFYIACAQPSAGQISRTPAGDLFPGTPVQFTASAAGTQPFSYAWTVDGQPAGGDSATLDHTFQTAGQHAVGATITNACGQTTAGLEVDVLAPPGPDLSTSSKSASQGAVDAGDALIYTLILRNTGPVAASASLTDPIPSHTVYVPGSAHASDLSPVTFDGSALHWAGQVTSDTSVTIQYTVQVGTALIGTAIENVAGLSDGTGHVTMLQASAIFNPGYRLTINEGALFTNNPTVSLRFAWNAAANITWYQISNDGGFTPGGSTTPWMPADPGNPTYSGWALAAYGDLRLPRTVYIRFRDATGAPFGPFQDDIILDPTPPQVDSLELAPLGKGALALRAASGKSVLVKVTAHDDNSGLQAVQLSNRSDFAAASSYPVNSGLTEITWPLQPSGLVYARVIDRAGNASAAVSAQGDPWWYRVYLPMLQRNGQ